MLKKAYEQAKEMLSENRELMDKLAGYLIEKETITGKEFMKIFRAEKGIPEPEEEEKDVTGAEAASTSDKASEDKTSEDKAPEEDKAGEEEKEEEAEKKPPVPEAPQGDVGIFSNHTIM